MAISQRMTTLVGTMFYGENKSIPEIAEELGLAESSVGRYIREFNLQVRNEDVDGSNILIYDIETAPYQTFTWTLRPDYINPDMVINDNFIISIAYKWLYSESTNLLILTPNEALKQDDSRILKDFHKVLNRADAVVTFNGDNYDNKHLNTRFLINGLSHAKPFVSIDVYKMAKKDYSFPSNSLDYLSKLLLGKGKIYTNFSLWREALKGNPDALTKMGDYNKNDVELTELLYLKLRQNSTSHKTIYQGSEVCPVCGSSHLIPYGTYKTNANEYPAFKCASCNTVSYINNRGHIQTIKR